MRRLILLFVATFLFTIAALLLYYWRTYIILGIGGLVCWRIFLTRLYPKPRRGGRGLNVVGWVDTAILAWIARRMPPRAKAEKIRFEPEPVYRLPPVRHEDIPF